ncbi:hypothetical protein B0H11DRAFT_2050353 [Mycena galericulata]|nr:hypothetical protein B0H11DRAFT_2050353 [Mycena galericulata]
MLPRTKGRRIQTKPDPQRNTVLLPQELIDAIIDEFDLSLKDRETRPPSFPDRKSLRAFSLVSHAFVGPNQRKLFSTVDLRNPYYYSDAPPDERSRLFSKLLSSKPHIGTYVKNLTLAYRSARSKSVEHVLSSLPNLRRLSLDPRGRHFDDVLPFSIHIRDSFISAFSLASLRRLELRRHRFTDALELDSILSNGIGLEELCLDSILFDDHSTRASDIGSVPARVVLRSLEFLKMGTQNVEAIMHAFTAVDITHLRSLFLDRYPQSFLRVNTISMEELTLTVSASHHGPMDGYFPRPLDQILTAKNSLRVLHLRVYYHNGIPRVIRQLGNLANLQALKRISITARCDSIQSDMWSEVDSLLIGVGSEKVQIYLDCPHRTGLHMDLEQVRQTMPALDAKGILRLDITPAGSEPEP